MDLGPLGAALQRDAVWVVFANVLAQQLGLPVPAVPTLLVAGSLAASGAQAGQMLAAAVLASVLADWAWYGAGRAFGYRVLSGLCRLSINPGSCVSQTEARFLRWGLWSLVVAKFVPGFSTVAPPIAGALRMGLPGFLAAAGAGAALWAGSALLAGWLLRGEVQRAIAVLNDNGALAAAVALGIVGVWLGWKLWQKFRFERLARIARVVHIAPDEFAAALASATPPLVLDLRGPVMIAASGPLPGLPQAVVADRDGLALAVGDWPKGSAIVTLCACPADAGAVQAAVELRRQGYRAARPLRGGYEAWLAFTANVPSGPDGPGDAPASPPPPAPFRSPTP